MFIRALSEQTPSLEIRSLLLRQLPAVHLVNLELLAILSLHLIQRSFWSTAKSCNIHVPVLCLFCCDRERPCDTKCGVPSRPCSSPSPSLRTFVSFASHRSPCTNAGSTTPPAAGDAHPLDSPLRSPLPQVSLHGSPFSANTALNTALKPRAPRPRRRRRQCGTAFATKQARHAVDDRASHPKGVEGASRRTVILRASASRRDRTIEPFERPVTFQKMDSGSAWKIIWLMRMSVEHRGWVVLRAWEP